MKQHPSPKPPDCPTEFAENLNFCQTCGATLIDAPAAEEPLDPFKTMIGNPADFAAAIPKTDPPPASPPPTPEKPEDVLDLPEPDDSRATQVVSEAEMRAELAGLDIGQATVVDIPPAVNNEPPPPAFIEPEKPAAPGHDLGGDPFMHTTPPIPSPKGQPLNMPKPEVEIKPEPTPEPAMPNFGSPFAEPPALADPFEQAASPSSAADPAPISTFEQQETSMQDQQFGQGPAGANMGGAVGGQQSKTLAVVSLVLGILGMTICCGSLLPSLAAVITGFMARGKANNDPMNYGGGGLALGGLITGVFGLLLSIGYLIFVFFLGGMELIMRGM
ncbi:MAG: DUF4190 domain-containing protein [Acidobacteria bacterium]|nr:DUF4190 domain-containing protein [Acidobacteriota bacterium]